MKNNEDSLVIYRLKKGEEKAYVSLVDLYSKRLFGYALSLTHDHAQSQDIVQNVFLKTWVKRKKLDIHSSLQNFLFKSVYNEFINQYKKKRSTMVLEQKYFNSLEKAVLLQDDHSFERILDQISKEISQLPPKCQQIFILSKKEGLTNSEISAYLNVSLKNVEAQITKAYGILRDRLGKKYKIIMMIVFGKDPSKVI
ncbi:sigma-70 family RNA polymerase sigma factor [Arenibacter sp. 6A1]|uniref:RNA polymerase sigma factor n=1 Tax=Arenibacter sp. 6A1 TaxID=2720391 RepID=UPI001444E099|nr:sigma-70 family RNA polymerase sigma factor [Arenibacter sp. 6A1]NKI27598.1 sigma-70 family RNA polymerase sigma factor [Arenibacter sp. 6A1]